jgi:hypothetical protein
MHKLVNININWNLKLVLIKFLFIKNNYSLVHQLVIIPYFKIRLNEH